MKEMSDMLKLIISISILAAIIAGVHYLGSLEDNQSKYTHPISQPGTRW